MRTRQRLRYEDSPSTWGVSLNGGAFSYTGPPCRNLVDASVMTDVIDNAFNFNPVSHMKLVQVPGNMGSFIREVAWPPGTFREAVRVGSYVSPFMFSAAQVVPLLTITDINEPLSLLEPGDAAAFTLEAFLKVLTQVPEEVSIANFILELKDARRLLELLRGLHAIPGMILNWNFGWLPLISDLKAFLRLVANVRLRLEHLKRVNGRTVTISHYQKFVYHDDRTPPTFPPHVWPEDGNQSITTTTYEEIKVRLHMSVAYDLDLRGVDAFVQAMCSALGLMNPAKIIWNAIPFSFVIDWLVNVTGLLDTLTATQPFKGTIAIKGAYHSFKTRTFLETWHPSYYPIAGNLEGTMYSEAQIHGFHRRVGIPGDNFDVSGLTPKQQLLAASLIACNTGGRPYSRRRRRR